MASDVVGTIMLHRALAFLELLVFFLFYAFKGAVSVALLALKPKLQLKPLIFELTLQTKTSFATSLLVNTYSLMPGTLSMGIEGDVLRLHILDEVFMDEAFIKQVQTKVLKVFS